GAALQSRFLICHVPVLPRRSPQRMYVSALLTVHTDRIAAMSSTSDRLVWIDCEMTGLDVEVDELVEVAVVVTDFDLNLLHPGFSVVIKPDQAALDGMSDFVRNMHAESGLIDEIPNGMSLADAEYAVNEYILKYVPTPGQAPLAGNT